MLDNVYLNHFNETPEMLYDVSRLVGLDIENFNNSMYRLLTKEFQGETLNTKDTLYIGTNSPSDLLYPAILELELHSTRNGNPHEETTESIGTLSEAQITALDPGNGIPSGMFPMDAIGYNVPSWEVMNLHSYIKYMAAPVAIIRVLDDLPFVIYSMQYVLTKGDWKISQQCPNWPGVDVYIYIGLRKGLPEIMLSETRYEDTQTNIYMGKLVKYTAMIEGLVPTIRLSGASVTSIPGPAAVPVGTGDFLSTGKLNPGWLGGTAWVPPDRPDNSGMTVTYYNFSSGGAVTSRGGKDNYIQYTNHLPKLDPDDPLERPRYDPITSEFTVSLTGDIDTFEWKHTRVSGTIAKLDANIDIAQGLVTFKVTDLPLGVTKIEFSSTSIKGKVTSEVVYLESIKGMYNDFIKSDLPPPVGTNPSGNSHYRYRSGIIDVEYNIELRMDGNVLKETYRYIPTLGLPQHSARLVRLSKGKYTVKFTASGGGTIEITAEDSLGKTIQQKISVKVDAEGPPVYNPVYTAILNTGVRVPITKPNIDSYNTYKDYGIDVLPIMAYEIEMVGAPPGYTFRIDTQNSFDTPGFKAILVPVYPNKYRIQLLKDKAKPPPGQSMQHLRATVGVYNNLNQGVLDEMYLRFIYG